MSTEATGTFVIYVILSYWAVGKLIYRNSIRFGAPHLVFFQQLVIGMLFGWLLVPIAILITLLDF